MENVAQLNNLGLQLMRRYAAIARLPAGVLSQELFTCGLPAAWLYMQALGLGEQYVTLLQQCMREPQQCKELLYLIKLANHGQYFFPDVPSGTLNIEVDAKWLAAQVEVRAPDFCLAYAFSPSELQQVLQAVAQPNKMIRIGDQFRAIGVILLADGWRVYHTACQTALEAKDVQQVSEIISKYLRITTQTTRPLVLQTTELIGLQYKPLAITAAQQLDMLLSKANPPTAQAANMVRYIAQAQAYDLLPVCAAWGIDLNPTFLGGINLLFVAYKNDTTGKGMAHLLQHGARLSSEQQQQLADILDKAEYAGFMREYEKHLPRDTKRPTY